MNSADTISQRQKRELMVPPFVRSLTAGCSPGLPHNWRRSGSPRSRHSTGHYCWKFSRYNCPVSTHWLGSYPNTLSFPAVAAVSAVGALRFRPL
jgi:hypothetical protein